ncbi:MAG: phosphoribosylformylglycinamidine cyclo-ligase [Myxococcota bacterium]|nr:phosphoribosylformylglycinamidine cyclo-ligase [Myxococcota bacterium]
MSHQRYKDAGVDIDAGARLIDRIAPFAKATSRPEVLGGLGHFGALWSIPAGRFEDLVLVSATDGVGTKIKVAQAANRHDTVGIDLVAMCVNDLLCTGAEPFFFLDYYATGKLDVDVAADVIEGIATGCEQAACALVGGETAEMPGVYSEGVYDLAGFSVGGCERSEILDGSTVAPGMVLVGLESSGLHSNGYSLARKILFEEQGLALDDPFPGTDHSVASELLTPTTIYVRPTLAALKRFDIASICHITGGGLPDNLPRVLADGCAARVELGSWDRPAVFRFLQEAGQVPDSDMLRTFNCGIGLVLVVPAKQGDELIEHFAGAGIRASRIGELVERAQDGEAVQFR